ncbi:MAG: outer membrane protein assembly factor BamE [Burkholderiales bacterium]|nr:outer membrane protein assembly factor BamE [Pseudomonadota bacterium]MCC7068308.1 outer membrane protein assembly factor BamE [Burkholderiales bacterium]
MRLPACLSALLAVFALSGCGLVYKMEINQGNYVTQDMVAKLREGQTRQQVKLALGTPTTESIFHADRWDYAYLLERRGKLVTSHRLTVFFDHDKLQRWDVHDLPSSPVVDRDPAYANLEKDKKSDDGPGWWSRIADWWRK